MKTKIIQITEAPGWEALFEDGQRQPLVGWALLNTGEVHGLVTCFDKIKLCKDADGLEGYSKGKQDPKR